MAVSLTCLPAALALDDGEATLLALGLAFSAGSVTSGMLLHRRLRQLLPPPVHDATRPMLRTLAASAVMAGPAYATAPAVSSVRDGPLGDLLGVLGAATAGGAAFVAAPLALARAELLRRRPATAAPGKRLRRSFTMT